MMRSKYSYGAGRLKIKQSIQHNSMGPRLEVHTQFFLLEFVTNRSYRSCRRVLLSTMCHLENQNSRMIRDDIHHLPVLSIRNNSMSASKDSSSADRAWKSYSARSFFCFVGLLASGRGGFAGALAGEVLNWHRNELLNPIRSTMLLTLSLVWIVFLVAFLHYFDWVLENEYIKQLEWSASSVTWLLR